VAQGTLRDASQLPRRPGSNPAPLAPVPDLTERPTQSYGLRSPRAGARSVMTRRSRVKQWPLPSSGSANLLEPKVWMELPV
jgi:hypothetical protein